MISYSYHVCIKIKFIPPLCLSLASGGGGGGLFKLAFPTILLHISLPTAVLTGTGRVVTISLSFQSSNPLYINLSNSLVFVLL